MSWVSREGGSNQWGNAVRHTPSTTTLEPTSGRPRYRAAAWERGGYITRLGCEDVCWCVCLRARGPLPMSGSTRLLLCSECAHSDATHTLALSFSLPLGTHIATSITTTEVPSSRDQVSQPSLPLLPTVTRVFLWTTAAWQQQPSIGWRWGRWLDARSQLF